MLNLLALFLQLNGMRSMAPFCLDHNVVIISFTMVEWGCPRHLIFLNHFDPGQCRSLIFKPAKAFDGQRLKNHVIRVEDVSERDFCGILCYMEPYCVSYNLGKQPRSDDGRYTCELNNATHEGNKDDLVEDQSYIFGGAEASANSTLN